MGHTGSSVKYSGEKSSVDCDGLTQEVSEETEMKLISLKCEYYLLYIYVCFIFHMFW